jgi:hypothetical protein
MPAQDNTPEEMVSCLTQRIIAVLRESGATFPQIIAALDCARAIVPCTDLRNENHYVL